VAGAVADVVAVLVVLAVVSVGGTVGAPKAADVADPVVVVAAVWPIPNAWKAAIMALTKVFSRNRGLSSSCACTWRTGGSALEVRGKEVLNKVKLTLSVVSMATDISIPLQKKETQAKGSGLVGNHFVDRSNSELEARYKLGYKFVPTLLPFRWPKIQISKAPGSR
jgi:hypothetical protein